MSKWLRREQAKACPFHKAILEESAARLAHAGDFKKDEVLKALNFMTIQDAIRWDYIREFLEEAQKCELVPVSLAYFKRHKREEEFLNPERFIAIGHGKKTQGYAAVIPENDHLVVRRIKYRKMMVNGTAEAFKRYVETTERVRSSPLPMEDWLALAKPESEETGEAA